MSSLCEISLLWYHLKCTLVFLCKHTFLTCLLTPNFAGKLCSFVATNFLFRFLIHILLQKIPVKADSWFTFYCRRYFLVQLPDSHSVAEDTMPGSESEDSPLHLTGSLPRQKAKATGQGDEPSSNDWVLKHNQGMHNLQVGGTQLLWRWMRQWVLAVKQCHMMINLSDLQTKLKNPNKNLPKSDQVYSRHFWICNPDIKILSLVILLERRWTCTHCGC
jgi:hypothetical protein